MVEMLSLWLRRRPNILRGIAVPLALAIGIQNSPADQPPTSELPAPAIAPAKTTIYDLPTCRRIALEKQPAIAAARASLAAAEARVCGLDSLHSIAYMARDMPIRRQQAAMGVLIAQAQLTQVEAETIYAVTRNYWSAVFALEQLQVADDALSRLASLKKDAEEAGNWVVDEIAVYIQVVQARRETALAGRERALAALREAMGIGPDCFLATADSRLPELNGEFTQEQVVSLALTHRGDMAQAGLTAQVVAAEVRAQASSLLPTARTFASGSDIHARPIPQGSWDREYRPGAIGPEMPTILVGKKAARVCQAQALSGRAEAMVEKTHNLIALEAEDAFLRWIEVTRQYPRFREAADRADKLSKKLQKDVKTVGTSVTMNDAISTGVTATQLRVQANEAHYQILLSLAAIERITAGALPFGGSPIAK